MKKSEETILKSLDINADEMLTHFNLGILYQEDLRFQKAIDSFRKSLNINPSFAEAHIQLAKTHLKTNDKESAKQSLEKALKVNPNNPKFKELYSKVLAS